MSAEPPRRVLVLGGARSGKSAFARRLAEQVGGPVLFVATAAPADEEMAARILAHRAERPADWRTIEAPSSVGEAIRRAAGGARTVLVDCLALLVSNCLVEASPAAGALRNPSPGPAGGAPGQPAVAAGVSAEVDALLDAARAVGCHLIVVSNEVGMGVVPAYPVGRAYRDLLGLANQRVAEAADSVYLMVAGIPVDLKRLGPSF